MVGCRAVPEVHLPHLDDHDDAPAATVAPTGAALHGSRGPSLFKLALEVVLIASGVFLGLAGEQWRETQHEHELARAALRRFRIEVTANRKGVVENRDYHATLKSDLGAWLNADTATRPTVQLHMDRSLAPVFFEHSAWDLALATQSLAHIDDDLAFDLARLYTAQQTFSELQTSIVQSTVYTGSAASDPERYFRSIHAFMGDVSYFDEKLPEMYDDVLKKLDAALRE
jgi:hypothetical protein